MSSFTALNLSNEDVELDAEEHTRELQVCFDGGGAAIFLNKWEPPLPIDNNSDNNNHDNYKNIGEFY